MMEPATPPAPDLTVIVVTHNGREMALATLRSARAAVGDAKVEWIVVDSGSSDGTADAIRCAYPDARVINAENRGFAAGNNVGLGLARGRHVLLLNPDIEVERGTLAELVAAIDARPGVGLVSVIQRGTDRRLQPSIRRFPSIPRDLGESLFATRWPVLRTWQELETRPEVYERECPVDWVVGAFLLARAAAIRDVGPMDDRFFLYSEEVDWCYRFHAAGWEVRHLPLMTITHHAGRRDRGDLMAQLAYSRRLFATKHYGPIKARGIRGALALGHLLRILGLAPSALRDLHARARIAVEGHSLAVQLGLTGAPRLGVRAAAHGAGPAASTRTSS
jgi:N-acetylglucosaminyl-diphospho-decaprenol L-rhamnosyltransferase